MDKLKELLDSYYSGDISPEDYRILLSAMEGNDQVSAEMKMEQKMFEAIESYSPSVPLELEGGLLNAIGKNCRRKNRILKMVYSGSAAAVILICIAFGVIHHGHKEANDMNAIAQVSGNEDYKELEKEVRAANDALLSVFSNISEAQAMLIESIDEIEIEQESDLIIF